MKLITGLGNPGKKYTCTRHNVGFLFVDTLREKFLYQKGIEITDWEEEGTFASELCFLKQGSRVLAILQKPLTFMNNSGDAVAKVIKKYGIEDIEKNFILIHDDLDIKLGKFKIQMGKSPSGHNGVKSVEERIKSTDFRRVRIGIEGREEKDILGEDYVLMRLSEEEIEIIDDVIESSIQGIFADILM